MPSNKSNIIGQVNIYWIDLFCGAGGTTTGIHLAGQKVVACVNHDQNALEAHEANHPDAIHFPEDIRDKRVVQKLKRIVNKIRKSDPSAVIAVWASLECTNFSKAKGGMPRDADSRTLAHHMYMYLEGLHPEYFWVENVREFMAWGPLDENGKPLSKTSGREYIRWVNKIKSFGYRSDWQILNSANYGAYQSRERLFIQFASEDLPISWPEQTHVKNQKSGGLFEMKKWKPVREVLNLDDHGKSIFNRKKALSENTLKRIYAGLVKFVAHGEKRFLKKYYTADPNGLVISAEGPSGAITTKDHHALIHTDHFLAKYFSGKPEGKVISVEGPAGTVTARAGQSLVSTDYLNTYYGSGSICDVELPSPTVTPKDRIAKVHVIHADQFILNHYRNGHNSDIDRPAGSVTTVPKHNLVSVEQWIMSTHFGNVGRSIDDPAPTLTATRRHPYLINANSSTCPPQDLDNPAPSITTRTHLLINPSWFGHATSIDEPSCTIIARQDKAPLYLIAADHGPVVCLIYDDDCDTMVKIKRFMVEYGITDIKMRMLHVEELLRIQGFPEGYVLKGTQTDRKKQIGNAVEVNQAIAIAKAFNLSLQKHFALAA